MFAIYIDFLEIVYVHICIHTYSEKLLEMKSLGHYVIFIYNINNEIYIKYINNKIYIYFIFLFHNYLSNVTVINNSYDIHKYDSAVLAALIITKMQIFAMQSNLEMDLIDNT